MAKIRKNIDRGAALKRSFIQSTYITATWTWFMIFAAKAAEPVLVASVLYASVKLLPIVHFLPQYDVVVFIAQFVALDIGGLSLNKLADQAKQEGNDEGASQAKRLSIALVIVMLVGVIMAGVDQVVRLDSQVGTVIDTILLIARAILAVLYSRVIHSLHNDAGDLYAVDEKEEIDERIVEIVKQAVQEALAEMRQEGVSHLEARLSQNLDERLTALDVKQAEAFARFTTEQAKAISETHETILAALETAGRIQMRETPQTTDIFAPSSNVHSLTEATSRKQQTGKKAEREIDTIVWPLLKSGMTVRAIAERANTSTATVGRSRKRWNARNEVSQAANDETKSETRAIRIQEASM